jgi:peptidoglycan/xylan/chitin deacetylase (PgdA/CDA1 family)
MNYFINNFQPCVNEDGRLIFPFIKRRQAKNIQILIYHRVNDDNDPFFPALPVDIFARQMEYLASFFNICSLEDAIERIKYRDVPDNTVVVTFDDGYADNYVNAFPILQKLSIPATIFLTTDAIGSGKVLWHDRVFSAFRHTHMNFLEGIGHNSTRYPLKTIEEKIIAQRHTLRFLWSLTNHERLLWINRLVDRLNVEDRKEMPDLMLTWDKVKIMYDGGMSFGSHTITHPILSRLSFDEAMAEIYGSKRIIEASLGTSVKTFAYPNGKYLDFNETTKEILKESGYICGLTTIFGVNEINQDLFELRRATPWDHNIHIFALRLRYYKFFS